MPRISSLLLMSAGLAALAACSDNNPLSQAPQAPVDQRSPEHLGVVPLRGVPLTPRFNNGNELNAGTTGGSLTQAGINYHGGPVLQAGTKVAAVYWSASTIYSGGPTPGTNGAGSADNSNVGYFLNHVGGSPYFNINTSYTNAAGLAIVNSVSYTQYYANNTSAPSGKTRVTDSQMLSMLQTAFNNGKLTYDPSTLYAIFTQGNVNLGGGFGTQYCAYHSWHGHGGWRGAHGAVRRHARRLRQAERLLVGARRRQRRPARRCRGEHPHPRDRGDHHRHERQRLVRQRGQRERRQVRLDLRHHLLHPGRRRGERDPGHQELPDPAQLAERGRRQLRPELLSSTW